MKTKEERIKDAIEHIVAWTSSYSPRLRDEPSAYKTALIRLGAEMAMKYRFEGMNDENAD